MSDAPTVSVVVATHDRRSSLARLLRALERQRGAPPFEVVMVDDGSTDGTDEELERLAGHASVPFTPLRIDANGGPAVARNRGWRAARGAVIAFTDDDCTPQPGWLACLAGALKDADVVQGRTVPDSAQMSRRNAFSHTVIVEKEWGFYEACNIGYRREVLERLDGFDERFGAGAPGAGPPFGEDTDLAWRARAAGARVVFEENALVVHDIRRRSYVDHLRAMRRREGLVRAVRTNPALRERLHHRWFWRASHPPALAAAVGVLLLFSNPTSGWRRLGGIALAAPYVDFRTRVSPLGRRRNWPAVIPLALGADLVEIGVLARASVRYRTLLL